MHASFVRSYIVSDTVRDCPCISLYILYCVSVSFIFFFFSSRRRHTRFDCDWSSDVCSSDLHPPSREGVGPGRLDRDVAHPGAPAIRPADRDRFLGPVGGRLHHQGTVWRGGRESGVEGKRVDLGGGRIIKKKKKKNVYG